ncbi:relaxase/mobilization nuclease domain-containing protein, partial [Staphylococcus warneri]|uniref:relaxase/mobilization nuclease domain-containing protein n=1 Tax=Staphylococcus warneri TaxID=1292 RepID=UPI0034D97DB2
MHSFKPPELTPQQSNQLPLELPENIPPNHQLPIYTHTHKHHLHNHILINSIHLQTPPKYQTNKQQTHLLKQPNHHISPQHPFTLPQPHTPKFTYTQPQKSFIHKHQYSSKDHFTQKIQ